MKTIRKIKVQGILTKLSGMFVGGIEDAAEISLIKNDIGYNISVKHKGTKLENLREVYLFPEPVEKIKAENKYAEFLLI